MVVITGGMSQPTMNTWLDRRQLRKYQNTDENCNQVRNWWNATPAFWRHCTISSSWWEPEYLHADKAIVAVIFERLLELHVIIREEDAPPIPPPSSSGLEQAEKLLIEIDLRDNCSIFDILRKFVDDDRVATEIGLKFAMLLDTKHYDSSECLLCKHAIFLLKRKVRSQ